MLAVLLVVLPIISRDFGLTFDEKVHTMHGRMLLGYFEGKNDLGKVSPFTEEGKLKNIPPEDRPDYTDLNFFGGTFDFICAWTYEHFPMGKEYEHRHIINALFGLIAMLFTGLMVKRIAGWRAGLIALLFIALSPRFVAHSMNNPKDVPLAAMMAMGLFFMVKFLQELPKPKIGTILLLALSIALAISIRVAAIILIPYLLLFAFSKQVSGMFSKVFERSDWKIFFRVMITALATGVAGYLLTALFWPYDRTNPVTVPLHVLSEVSHLDIFNSYDLFDGKWWNREEIPWYYVPKWIIVGTPLFIFIGLLLSPFLFFNRIPGEKKINPKYALLLLFCAVFPIALVIWQGSYVFHDGRHLLFTYPPLVALCALGWENIFRTGFHKYFRYAVAVLLALICIQPLLYMKRNHPNEGTYFSPLIGGIKGAFKKYETDYYGNCIRQGVDWIQQNAKPATGKKIRITTFFGSLSCSTTFVDTAKGFVYVSVPQNSSDWDYAVLMASAAKLDSTILTRWPPKGTVHEIKADGVPICAVIKNPNVQDDHFLRGFELYQQGRFEESVKEYLLAVERDPRNADAWNNLGVSYGALGRWQEEADACAHALEIDPHYDLARNNMNDALSRLKK